MVTSTAIVLVPIVGFYFPRLLRATDALHIAKGKRDKPRLGHRGKHAERSPREAMPHRYSHADGRMNWSE
jgi:hypothetical protein